MELHFNEALAMAYKSQPQKIRVMSERWVEENMYCPCCGKLHIKKLENNKPVSDFYCKGCDAVFELKSKQGKIGKKIIDGAYKTMIDRITSATNPELFVLSYTADFNVKKPCLIPRFFLTPQVIEKRKKLPPTARRAGWEGCNILYEKIPDQAKIEVITDAKVKDKLDVVGQYNRIKKIQTNNLESRGWMIDVLNCINAIPTDKFLLREVYAYAEELQLKHSNNHNVEAKIRQQLQILRDKGFVEFLGKGCYKKIV